MKGAHLITTLVRHTLWLLSLPAALAIACAAPAIQGGSLLAASSAQAQQTERFAAELPRFQLRDPHGQLHRSEDLLDKGGLVVVVTAPTYANEDAQKGWAKHLGRVRAKDERLVFLQDVSQTWFEETARERMRKSDDQDEPPLLLVDPEGAVREALEVEKGKTVVLVYGPEGELRAVETGQPSQQAAAKLWRALPDGSAAGVRGSLAPPGPRRRALTPAPVPGAGPTSLTAVDPAR